jgi:hypothetical protein
MATRSQTKGQTFLPIGGRRNPQRQSYTQHEVCMEHLRSLLLVGRDKPRAGSPAAVCIS